MALKTTEILIPEIQENKVRKGLMEVKWPGRLELFSKNPHVLLDGAHNPKALEILISNLKRIFPDNSPTFILGFSAHKNIQDIVKEFKQINGDIIVTEFSEQQGRSPANPESIVREFKKIQTKTKTKKNLSEALDYALFNNQGLICITGSLFLVGEARKLLTEKNGS